MNEATIDENQIRETAYLFWLDEGQPHGRGQEHWLRAVDVLTRPTPKAKPTRKASAKPRVAKVATKRKANAQSKTATK